MNNSFACNSRYWLPRVEKRRSHVSKDYRIWDRDTFIFIRVVSDVFPHSFVARYNQDCIQINKKKWSPGTQILFVPSWFTHKTGFWIFFFFIAMSSIFFCKSEKKWPPIKVATSKKNDFFFYFPNIFRTFYGFTCTLNVAIYEKHPFSCDTLFRIVFYSPDSIFLTWKAC